MCKSQSISTFCTSFTVQALSNTVFLLEIEVCNISIYLDYASMLIGSGSENGTFSFFQLCILLFSCGVLMTCLFRLTIVNIRVHVLTLEVGVFLFFTG